MSATVRAFFGALVGALIVLLAHPYSRPYLLQGTSILGESDYLRETSRLAENIDTLPQPSSLEEAGLWAMIACQRTLTSHDLTREEAVLVIEVIQQAAESDPDNAFWRHVEAVLQLEIGNTEVAIEAWRQASLASRWSDYQNARLTGVLDGLAGESGRNLGWHYALVDSRKDPVAAHAILAFARRVLRGEATGDFELRLATLRNGRLLRDGSRTVDGAEMGVETSELAAYCTLGSRIGIARSGGPLTPRMIATARDDLISIAQRDRPEVEQEIRDVFLDNDARAALISRPEADAQRLRLNVVSILTAALPGALLTLGLIGGVLYFLGRLIARIRPLQTALTPPWSILVGVVAGGAAYAASGLFFPSLWAAVTFATFGIRRSDERQAAPLGLGPGYGVTIASLSVALSLIVALYLVSRSQPGEYLMSAAGLLDGPIMSDETLLGLALVVASLGLVSASVWGFLSRIPAEKLAGPTLAKFGATVCLGCFASGIVLAPISIAVDRSVGASLQRIFQNEPTYYLTQ
jgi:hypothetical protein